jgi:hypothetical protein
MKLTKNIYAILLCVIVPLCTTLKAQVGINTTNPKGLLDANSTTMGVVYPNVALTATDEALPVVNPQGGTLAAGTVVYNTNTTYSGNVTDVHPGIYVWDGSKWTIHYKKRQAELFEQDTELRTASNYPGNWQGIPNLRVEDNKTFTPNYSGLYRIIVKGNYGGGQMDAGVAVNVAAQEGVFRFTFDGITKTFITQAYSIYNSYVNSGTHYKNIWKESYTTLYLNLTADTTYSFSLEFDQYDAPGFVNNGNSGTGMGYIGTDIPCTVEFTYMDE